MSKMISSTTTIQVVLSAAVTTNQLPCTASWMDQGGLGGDSTANTNSTTAVTLVTAPAASVERLVTDLSICNTDTANATVTINKVVSGTPSEWAKFLLPPGYRASYDGHWRVMDPSGNFCETVTVTSGTLTVNQGTANATPWNENIAQWGGTATSLGQKVSASSVPVVLASDYYPAGASCVTLTGTTAQTLAAATTVVIRSISVTSVGAVLAAGSVAIEIFDGGGTLRSLFTVPTAVTTAAAPWTFDIQNLATPLANGGNVSTIKLTANLTSGSFVVAFSL
jgi:hypothetical protein